MDSRRWYTAPVMIFVFSLCMLFVGCRGADHIALKDREIKELRYEKERMRGSLSQTISEVEKLRKRIEVVEGEKSAEIEKNEGLQTQLRFANEQSELAARERQKVETDLEDSRARSAMLERSLSKVKSVASASAGELAELRLNAKGYGQDFSKLREEAGALREDRTKLVAKVDKLQDELIKSKAVVRSLRSGTTNGKDRVLDLESQIETLQTQNADLRGEKIAMENRISNLSSREEELSQALVKQKLTNASSQGTTIDSAKEQLVYQTDPNGLAKEFGGFLEARYRSALTGNIGWDTFDKAVVGFSGVLFMFVVWTMLRSRRTRRLKREIHDLTEELEELEAVVQVDEEQYVEPRPAVRNTRRPARVAGSRRSGGFSAVISSKAVGSKVEVQEEDVIEEAPTMVMDPPFSSAGNPARTGARKVIGARTWGGNDEAVDEADDALASTQVITNVTQEELQSENLLTPGVNASLGAKQTQKKSEHQDPELLAELKAVINKKFDEIVD